MFLGSKSGYRQHGRSSMPIEKCDLQCLSALLCALDHQKGQKALTSAPDVHCIPFYSCRHLRLEVSPLLIDGTSLIIIVWSKLWNLFIKCLNLVTFLTQPVKN
jgi:hypothetical protein